MIFQVNPLVVFKCSLESGVCDIEQENQKGSELIKNGYFLRGGSPLVPVPQKVVDYIKFNNQTEDLEMWLTFTKTHIDNCGCGSALYRPVLTVLVKQDGVYHIDYLSESIDFGTVVKSFDDNIGSCGHANVLNPNSIAFWEIETLDPLQSTHSGEIPRFKDYMGLTVSEADNNVQMVLLKNVLNYILGLYIKRNNLGGFELKPHHHFEKELAEDKSAKLAQCMLKYSELYCVEYGMEHPGGG